MMQLIRTFSLWLCLLVMGISVSGQTIGVCDGDEEWPPFSFFERQENGDIGEDLKGFAVELIHEILSARQIEYSIDKQLPWPRCQAEVARGDRFQIVLQAGSSAERLRDYYLVGPIYSLRMSYYYSRDRFPDGLTLEKPEDVNRYRICGLNGYDYSYPWLDVSKLDSESVSYENLTEKLTRDRCDIFLESGEVLAGIRRLEGREYLDDLAGRTIPDIEPDDYYILVTRKASNSEELRRILEDGLQELRENGFLEDLEKRYF